MQSAVQAGSRERLQHLWRRSRMEPSPVRIFRSFPPAPSRPLIARRLFPLSRRPAGSRWLAPSSASARVEPKCSSLRMPPSLGARVELGAEVRRQVQRHAAVAGRNVPVVGHRVRGRAHDTMIEPSPVCSLTAASLPATSTLPSPVSTSDPALRRRRRAPSRRRCSSVSSPSTSRARMLPSPVRSSSCRSRARSGWSRRRCAR